MELIVPHKKTLGGRIREMALALDLSRFKDSMQPLIKKDIEDLVTLIESQN